MLCNINQRFFWNGKNRSLIETTVLTIFSVSRRMEPSSVKALFFGVGQGKVKQDGIIYTEQLMFSRIRENDTNEVRKKARKFMQDLADLAQIRKSVYRGESQCHVLVSSGLYRSLHEIRDERFDIKKAQERQLEAARLYTKEKDRMKILAELQHKGGKTNLIDFTSDLNIALFFACNYDRDKDGRVILLSEYVGSEYEIIRPQGPDNMIDVQKSLFVLPDKGYVDSKSYLCCEIPKELKKPILEYLKVVHGIDDTTAYNDLSGFIRDQDRINDLEAEFFAGIECIKKENHEKAVNHFTRSLEASNPRIDRYLRHAAHYERGLAYYALGKMEEAAEDFLYCSGNKQIELPDFAADLAQKYKRWLEKVESQPERHEFPGLVTIILKSSGMPAGESFNFTMVSPNGYQYSCLITNEGMITLPSTLYLSEISYWITKDFYRGVNWLRSTVGEAFEVETGISG